MARDDAFKVEGVVAEAMPNRTYVVRLSNGHQLLGFVPGKAGDQVRFAPGDTVSLELSAYDLSKGRILVGKN